MGCATALFQNKLLFHDVDQTVSVFIHFFPALVFYTLRWQYSRLNAKWPSLFYRGPFDDIEMWEIVLYAVAFYLLWFIPYFVWMLLGGSRLPQNQTFDTCLGLNKRRRQTSNVNTPHDTVFHFNMRDITFGKICRKAGGYEESE